MDFLTGLSTSTLFVLFQTLGLPGLILVIWASDHRTMQKTVMRLEAKHDETTLAFRKEISTILDRYREDMATLKNMYVTNASLVKRYEQLATESSDYSKLGIQILSKMSEQIRNNLYCPVMRERK